MINELEKRILVLDGATGTAIQKYNLTEKDFRGELFKEHPYNLQGCNEILNLTRPDIIREIHLKYLASGADIIETNSFNCCSVSLEEYGITEEAYKLSRAGAEIAVAAAKEFERSSGKKIFVAGSIGPTSKSTSIPSGKEPYERTIDFDTLQRAYEEQIEGVIDGGVDLLLIETIYDGLNAKAAVITAEKLMEKKNKKLPIMISATVDKNGRIFSGQSMESLIISLDRDSIISYGFNCSFGAEDLVPLTEKLGEFTGKYISLYPNAGLPDENGEYRETAEITVSHLQKLIDEKKVNILGGCCGTTYEHIEAIAQAVKNKIPRKLQKKNLEHFLSANDILNTKKEFLKVGERNNVSGSRLFKKLIESKDYVQSLEIAKKQIAAGAHILDINLDDGMLDSKSEMEKFCRILQNDPVVSKVPFMIDSSDFEVIEAALKNIPGRAIVNSLSLKEGEEEFVRKAKIIKNYGAALVVMAFDEKGQGVSADRKIQICNRAYHLLKKLGFSDSSIYFDPNILTVGTGSEADRKNGSEFLKAISWIRENLPETGITGGLSNLSFAFRGNNPLRASIHSIFLKLAQKAGMNMVIMNPSEKAPDISPLEAELIENLILGTGECPEEVLLKDIKPSERTSRQTEQKTLQERITDALINGGSVTFEDDIREALSILPPLDIIQKLLMTGLEKVGELFEKGELYLPQVIRSASVMNKAVDILLPLLDKNDKITSRGKVLMATVEGDVHDIGKNIAGTVLKCNGFEIIDLGVMVSKEKILQGVLEYSPDVVTLSGLISPSLKEMEKVLALFKENNLDVPVLIAGAAASKLHTAVKLEPIYPGKTLYATDASGTVPVVSALCSQAKKDYLLEKTAELVLLRDIYKENNKNKENKIIHKKEISTSEVYTPKSLGKAYLEVSLNELEKYINWDILLHNLKVKNTDVEAETLREAKELYKRMEKSNYRAKCTFGIFPCKKEADRIIVTDKQEITLSMPFLSNFFQEKDYIGAFVISVSGNFHSEEEYLMILENLIAMRIAEAASEYLQQYINNLWKVSIRPAVGYPSLPDHSLKKEIFQLVDGEKTGAKLSSTYAMIPAYSVCGVYISNPESFYLSFE